MKRYCFDTSGISHPLEHMPEDIHGWMWKRLVDLVVGDNIAVTTEIYDEMTHIPGLIGHCICNNKKSIVLEILDDGWDWATYAHNAAEMQKTHHDYISEYNGGSKKTVCLNDLSIIALAKTLKLPIVSMEARVREMVSKHRRIPNICDAEGVEHLTFSDFLRREQFRA